MFAKSMFSLSMVAQIIATPLFAWFNSDWVDGPYFTVNGQADDGIEVKVDEIEANKFLSNYNNYE